MSRYEKDPKSPLMDYDDVLRPINEFGLWQKGLFILLWLPAMASAMAVFLFEFTGYTPSHRCKVEACELNNLLDLTASENNGTMGGEGGQYGNNYFLNFTVPFDEDNEEWDSCQMYRPLHNDGCSSDQFTRETINCPKGYIFRRTLFTETVTTELKMVCQQDWKKSSVQSIYMIGMLVGSFFFGTLSDAIGRKTTLMITIVVMATAGTLSACVPADPDWFPMFAITRFISGCGHVGVFMMSFALAMEYTGPNNRVLCGCLIETPYSIGALLVGFFSWLGIRNWRHLQLLCSTPWYLLLGLYWILPESPRWLLAKGKLEELEIDIQRTADFNGKPFPERIFSQLKDLYPLQSKLTHQTNNVVVEDSKWSDLFRNKTITLRTLNIFYNWVISTLCYYCLTTTASQLSENLFLNYALVILVEIPSHFFCIIAVDSVGRKPILGLCQIISGLACILAAFLRKYPTVQIILSLVGKFGATAAFTVIFLYTAEMFPTEIRSRAIGASSTCARIGGILAPQVAYLAVVWKPLPLILMGVMGLLAGIFTVIGLPETLGEKLPETMDEALQLGRARKSAQLRKKFLLNNQLEDEKNKAEEMERGGETQKAGLLATAGSIEEN